MTRVRGVNKTISAVSYSLGVTLDFTSKRLVIFLKCGIFFSQRFGREPSLPCPPPPAPSPIELLIIILGPNRTN